MLSLVGRVTEIFVIDLIKVSLVGGKNGIFQRPGQTILACPLEINNQCRYLSLHTVDWHSRY